MENLRDVSICIEDLLVETEPLAHVNHISDCINQVTSRINQTALLVH